MEKSFTESYRIEALSIELMGREIVKRNFPKLKISAYAMLSWNLKLWLSKRQWPRLVNVGRSTWPLSRLTFEPWEEGSTNWCGRVVTYDLVKSNRSTRPRYSVDWSTFLDRNSNPPQFCEQFLPFVPRKSMSFTDWPRSTACKCRSPRKFTGWRGGIHSTSRYEWPDSSQVWYRLWKTIRFLKFLKFLGVSNLWILDSFFFFKFRSFKLPRSLLERCR